MRTVLIVFCILAVTFACDKIGKQDQIVFDKAKLEMLTPQKTWYCQTQTEFRSAQLHAVNGDVIKLDGYPTNYYFVCDTFPSGVDILSWSAPYYRPQVYIDSDTLGSQFPCCPQVVFEDSDIKEIYIHPDNGNVPNYSKIILTGTCEIDDVMWSVDEGACGIYETLTIRLFYYSSVTFIDCLSGFTRKPGYGTGYYGGLVCCDESNIDIYNCAWIGNEANCSTATHCSRPYSGTAGEFVIHSWVYNDTTYNYSTFDICDSGAWWDIDNNEIVFCGASHNYNVDAKLIYGSTSCSNTVDMADYNQPNICQSGSGTEFYYVLNVSPTQQRVYWKIEATLCDSTLSTSCAMKAKPRTSDPDPPPNPEQQ